MFFARDLSILFYSILFDIITGFWGFKIRIYNPLHCIISVLGIIIMSLLRRSAYAFLLAMTQVKRRVQFTAPTKRNTNGNNFRRKKNIKTDFGRFDD